MNQKYWLAAASKKLPLVFSSLYSFLLTLMTYPGILYSDTVIRWKSAFDLFSGAPVDDTNPVAPFLWMRALFAVTGEVGIVTVLQAFALSLGAFHLASQLIRPRSDAGLAAANLGVVAVLLLPVQIIYSVFQTFDTPAAAIMLWLSVVLIRLWRGDGGTGRLLLAVAVLLFFLVAYRLPALPVAVLVGVLAFGTAYARTRRRRYIAGAVPGLALLALPFVIGPVLSVQPASLWVGGPVWRYMIAAPQSKNPVHEAFLQQVEGLVKGNRGPPCYVNVYCSDNDYWQVLDRIRIDPQFKKRFVKGLKTMAREEPLLVLKTGAEFAGYVLGVQMALQNAEVGRWRDPVFRPRIEALGFKSNERREGLVDWYFGWMRGPGAVLLRPLYLMLFTALVIVAARLGERRTDNDGLALRCSVPFSLGTLYYLTFIPVSQSHELRYFYPTLLGMQVVWMAVAVALVLSLMQRGARITD